MQLSPHLTLDEMTASETADTLGLDNTPTDADLRSMQWGALTVFSEVLEASRALFEAGALVLFSVTVEDRDGEARFTAEGARRLDAAAAQTTSQLRVLVATETALEGVKRRLEAVKPASRHEGGDVIVTMRLPESGREVAIDLGVEAACTPSMRGALKSVEGVVDVELV